MKSGVSKDNDRPFYDDLSPVVNTNVERIL